MFLGIKKKKFCLLTPYFLRLGGILIFLAEMGGIYCFFKERYLGGILGFQQGGGMGATPADRPGYGLKLKVI